jgi:hypothetical protein
MSFFIIIFICAYNVWVILEMSLKPRGDEVSHVKRAGSLCSHPLVKEALSFFGCQGSGGGGVSER